MAVGQVTYSETHVADLQLTGERTVPDLASENYWFRRHEAAHRQLLEMPSGGELNGGALLEVGAGEGYGAAMLSASLLETASSASDMPAVIALDYDRSAIEHLAARYSPGGLLAISTPNRLTFSPGSDGLPQPRNPFHSHEFIAAELTSLIRSAGFAIDALAGLDAGPRLLELDRSYQRAGQSSFVAAQLDQPAASWSTQLATDVASMSVADFVVTEPATDRCLDLILLARAPS